jgi:hypothetical protein
MFSALDPSGGGRRLAFLELQALGVITVGIVVDLRAGVAVLLVPAVPTAVIGWGVHALLAVPADAHQDEFVATGAGAVLDRNIREGVWVPLSALAGRFVGVVDLPAHIGRLLFRPIEDVAGPLDRRVQRVAGVAWLAGARRSRPRTCATGNATAGGGKYTRRRCCSLPHGATGSSR